MQCLEQVANSAYQAPLVESGTTQLQHFASGKSCFLGFILNKLDSQTMLDGLQQNQEATHRNGYVDLPPSSTTNHLSWTVPTSNTGTPYFPTELEAPIFPPAAVHLSLPYYNTFAYHHLNPQQQYYAPEAQSEFPQALSHQEEPLLQLETVAAISLPAGVTVPRLPALTPSHEAWRVVVSHWQKGLPEHSIIPLADWELAWKKGSALYRQREIIALEFLDR